MKIRQTLCYAIILFSSLQQILSLAKINLKNLQQLDENQNKSQKKEPVIVIQGNEDDPLMEFRDEKLQRGCVNPAFRNTTTGQRVCQNIAEQEAPIDLTARNCTLQYYRCCESTYTGDNNVLETIRTCVWINKCSSFFAVTTCVTPQNCNKTCDNTTNNTVLQLFGDALNASNATSNVRGFIAGSRNIGVPNLSEKDWVRYSSCVGKEISKEQGQQINCCTGCETQYYSNQGELLLYYDIPDFNKSDISPILLARNVSAGFHFTSIRDKNFFLFNPCIDDRVQNLFNVNPNNEVKYQQMCRNLAFDWGQYFAPYNCTPWFCNLQGTCSVATNETLGKTVIPTCNCLNNFKGKNCIFNTTNYDYLSRYMSGLDTWVDKFVQIKDEETFASFLLMVEQMAIFESNADPADKDRFAKTVAKFWRMLGNAEYSNVTDEFLMKTSKFVPIITDYTNSISGLEDNSTNAILSKFPTVSYDTPNHAYFTSLANSENETILGGDRIIHPLTNISNLTQVIQNESQLPQPFNVTVVNNTEGIISSVTATLPNNTNVTILPTGGGRRLRESLNLRDLQEAPANNTTIITTAQPAENQTVPATNITVVNVTQPAENVTTPVPAENQTVPTANLTILNVTNASQPQPEIQIGQGQLINILEGRRNPKAIIPLNATKQLPNDTVYSIFVLKNPLPLIQENQPFIYSQLVKVLAFKSPGDFHQNISTNVTNDTLVVIPSNLTLNSPNPGGRRVLQNVTIVNATGTQTEAQPNATITEQPQQPINLTLFNTSAGLPNISLPTINASQFNFTLPNLTNFTVPQANITQIPPSEPTQFGPSHAQVLLNTTSGIQDITYANNTTIIMKTDPSKFGNNTIILNGTSNTNITVIIEGSNVTTGEQMNQTLQLRGAAQPQIEYPANSENMTILLPWTYTPLIVNGNYNESCQVYSFDGYKWSQENGCSVDQKSDSRTAVIVCNKFGLYGVHCNVTSIQNSTQQNNQSISVASTGVPSFRIENTSSSSFLGSALFAALVFVFGLFVV